MRLNPSIGRFITRDTYEGNIYQPWTQNLYTYCNNNPINYVDPTGHSAADPGVIDAMFNTSAIESQINEQKATAAAMAHTNDLASQSGLSTSSYSSTNWDSTYNSTVNTTLSGNVLNVAGDTTDLGSKTLNEFNQSQAGKTLANAGKFVKVCSVVEDASNQYSQNQSFAKATVKVISHTGVNLSADALKGLLTEAAAGALPGQLAFGPPGWATIPVTGGAWGTSSWSINKCADESNATFDRCLDYVWK